MDLSVDIETKTKGSNSKVSFNTIPGLLKISLLGKCHIIQVVCVVSERKTINAFKLIAT